MSTMFSKKECTGFLAVDEDLTMEQTVAERPLSQEQQIDNWQTCNVGAMGIDSHLREDPSESWYPRRRTGSSSFRSDDLLQDKHVCRDFLRGKCARGTSCKFGHSESDGQDGNGPHVCLDFLGNRCNRVSCKFLHPESDRSNGCGPNGKENLGCAANSGKSQFYGENMYRDSSTRSFPREHRSRSPCRRFLNGMCFRGESCPYLHSEYAGFNRSSNDYSTPLQQGVVTTSRNHGFGEGHRGNNLWTSQEHEEANGGNVISTRFSSREYRSRSPCRNFLRGRCYSGEACPYNHPDAYLRPRNDGTPPWQRGPGATTGNPSFGKERVDMTSRTSEDHEKGNEGNGRSTGSFYAGQRSRSPCRNFIRGRCHRGAHCSYLHTNTRPEDDCSTQRQPQVAVTSENSGFAEGSVHITSRTSEEHLESNVGGDRIPRSFSAGFRSKSPCRDFLRGRCSRGACCPYLHLDNDIYVRPKDDSSTQLNHEVAATSVNPGFGEGREGITLRTCQEHGEANTDDNLRSSYFPRGPRSRSPCRRFLSGRCYRGASCPYLHLERHDRSSDIACYERNRDKDNMGIASRSWSPDRQRSRPLGDLGADKPRPEVCLKYGRGRCTLGESCKYLHSFHEYAKSASDCTKQTQGETAVAPRNSGVMHQCDPSMVPEELDGSFEEKTKGKYADNAEEPNITDVKDELAVGDQQKGEVSGEAIARNSEADEDINLCHQPFKRQRRSSRSPFSPRDDFDGRKRRRDESQDNFHSQRHRSGSSLTPRDDFGSRNIRHESYSNFPRGRCHNVAPFRYPYSHSYRYNGPRYYINKEPQVAATAGGPSSHNIREDPNVMETQGRDEVKSHEMQLDQCPNISLDSSTRIVDKEKGPESVEDAVQPSLVDEVGEPVVSNGENAVVSVVATSDATCSCGENCSSHMDITTPASNKDDNAEVKIDLSQEGSDKTDSKKQAAKTYVRKMDRKSCSKYCMEPLKREAIDLSTCVLPSNSAVEASSRQPDMSGARVSESAQDVLTIGHLVQQLEQGNEIVTNEIQENDVSEGTTNDGSSVVGYSKRNSMQTSQSSLKSAIPSPRRKLLVLDVNGLLADIVNVGEVPRGYRPDTIIAMKAVFRRPFCDDFLEFCFDRFDVGVWSSRNKKNVDRVIDFLMFNNKNRLLFCWDQAHCTETGYKTIENRDKPLVLKELKKLWEKQETDLPWEKGFYNEMNTVLLDDSPYKALRNPPYTAIFPYAYKYRDTRDRSLGRGGDLRVYLEKLAAADNVQKFIQENPFGQRSITKSNLSWGFYSKIVGVHANQQGNSSNTPAMEVVGSRASQRERDAGNSSATESAGDHAEEQKGNVDNSLVTKSVGDHTKQQEENADKASATKDLGAHLDRQDGNVDNTIATNSAATHVNQQEGSADKTIYVEAVACENQQEGNADKTSDTEVVAHETHLVGNTDNTTDTKVVAHDNQQGGNAGNTADIEVVAHETQQGGNANSIHATTTSVGAHVNRPTKIVNNTSKAKVVVESLLELPGGNSDDTSTTNVEVHGSQQEGTGDETPATS